MGDFLKAQNLPVQKNYDRFFIQGRRKPEYEQYSARGNPGFGKPANLSINTSSTGVQRIDLKPLFNTGGHTKTRM
ncbi:hypothetical protein ACN1C3_19485 [Pseudomonas sp. H11T01]|uniref:hypothetical protein n=1 Tax=Pseudomonas sp. H11T01 TaxID=3402749 RepID=UPI003AD42BF4